MLSQIARAALHFAILSTCCAPTPLAAAAPAPRAEAQEPLIRGAIEKVSPALVTLWFGKAPRSHASGTIVTPDGWVVTAGHIDVPAGGEVEVRTADGKVLTARVVGKTGKAAARGTDLALVKLPGAGPWPAAALGSCAGLTRDVPLLAAGYPETGLLSGPGELPPLYARLGRRTGDAEPNPAGTVRTTIRGAPGDSGGAVLDLGGRLVGVITRGDPSGTGVSFNTTDLLLKEWDALSGGVAPPEVAGAERPQVATSESELVAAVAATRRLAVEVRSRERLVATGTVVGRGLVLTKASELGPDLTAVLENDTVALARIAAADPLRDLALLTIADDLTDGLPAVPWAEAADLHAGRVMAAVTPEALAPAFGMIAVAPRPVPPAEGSLGVAVQDAAGGVAVTEVARPLTPTRLQHTFPLRVGDVITAINGTATPDMAGFLRVHQDWLPTGERPRVPGEPVTVRYRRDGSEVESTFPLNASSTIVQRVRPYSHRHTSFPRAAVAHFTPSRLEMAGALVVDSRGRAVGVYIARAPMVEDLVLPADEVKAAIQLLRERAVSGGK